MRVCYFGPFDPNYPRNRVVIKGLRKNNIDVVECNSHSFNRFLDYVKLLKKHQTLKYDVILLGARGTYFGQPLVPLLRGITRKPIVFDAVLTLTETMVVDTKLVKEGSARAKLLYFLDCNALRNASLVLSDTYAHAIYYSQLCNVDYRKFRRVLIGSDDEVFYPRVEEKGSDCFLVMFWGGFNPLQGVKFIIRAAKLLENYKDIKFQLRGFGQTYFEALELSKSLGTKNIEFVPTWIPYYELPNHIAKADVCLGIFGETEKAHRVIPNKAAETLAMKKTLITGSSPATREIFEDGKHCALVPMANPKALAEKILTLKENKKLKDKMAENGFRLFKEKLSPKAVGKELKLILMDLVEKSK